MYATDPVQRHNGRLLMDYGFVLEDNPYDSVTVEMPKIDADDKDAKLRAMVLAWIPSVASSVLHMPRLNSSSVMTSELMTVMRCLTMRKESLQEIINARSIEPSSHQDIKRINQLPPPDELQALTKAISHLHTALNKYTSTVEEDEEILLEKSEALTLVVRNIVILRKEKRILRHNLLYLEQHMIRIKRWFSNEL
ncbi:uncharacterized protein LOC134195357 [Corticium candelabrum]|uniref:uncharacterized protein LOC134195357 n=1 Tax=Corticium candelabrum TaxID=121492 RepID=UPI002E268962|nr:uncharacterized protein LOC134195357 [Corticium candelabrum]